MRVKTHKVAGRHIIGKNSANGRYQYRINHFNIQLVCHQLGPKHLPSSRLLHFHVIMLSRTEWQYYHFYHFDFAVERNYFTWTTVSMSNSILKAIVKNSGNKYIVFDQISCCNQNECAAMIKLFIFQSFQFFWSLNWFSSVYQAINMFS